jgi:hypothetical protein
MERLSAASAMATGHELIVFSYGHERLRQTGLEAQIEDAREVFSDPSLDSLRGSLPDHFVDHFRLEGLAKAIGTWVDLDVVYLSRIPSATYLFGWEQTRLIGAGVLQLPPRSAVLADYLAICRRRPVSRVPPWLSWRQRAHRTAKYWVKGRLGQPLPGLPYGPQALTHLARKHGLTALALSPSVFYPIAPREVSRFAADDDAVESTISGDTITVHLYRSDLVKHGLDAFPTAGTWLGKKCREFAINR